MQLGIKLLPEALAIARDLHLDLVEVAPFANPPVCRIMDFGMSSSTTHSGLPFKVIDLGSDPGDPGGGGRVREPRRPSPGSGSGSAELPT